MGRDRTLGSGGFHDTSLVIFTALGTAGAGLGSAHLLEVGIGGGEVSLRRVEAILISGLLLLGFMVSIAHLGRPLKGLFALKRVGHSRLTNEVLALGLALLGSWLSLVFPTGTGLSSGLGLLASVASICFLLALGFLYNLPGQESWRGPVVFQPLLLGTAWGILAIGAISGQAMVRSSLPILGFLLMADGFGVVHRFLVLTRNRRGGLPAHPQLFRIRGWWLWGRLALSGFMTPLALLTSSIPVALGVFTVALGLDRFSFYALSLRVTTESEIVRMESLFE